MLLLLLPSSSSIVAVAVAVVAVAYHLSRDIYRWIVTNVDPETYSTNTYKNYTLKQYKSSGLARLALLSSCMFNWIIWNYYYNYNTSI